MFKSTAGTVSDSWFPHHSSFREQDWTILASFWHPLAFEKDVGDQPVAVRLLDLDLVVYRTLAGVTVALDRCPHRGTRISRGKIIDDLLVCPMHGFAFEGRGQCRRIPSMGSGSIPRAMGLKTVRTITRYGLIWACLRPDPVNPLPDWPAMESVTFPPQILHTEDWDASAARHVENFNDITHFPFVHLDSFGGNPNDPAPLYEVERTAYGLSFGIPYLEWFNRFPDNVEKKHRDVWYHYEFTYPFASFLKVKPIDSNYELYFGDIASPISAHKTRIFQLAADNSGKFDEKLWTRDTVVINGEDQPLVEGQSPKDLPLNLTEEVHVPADRFSLEYRRGLVSRFGLGAA